MNTAVIFLLSFLLIPFALADETHFVLERTIGSVWVVPAEMQTQPMPVSGKMILLPGDYVITGENSKAIIRAANQRVVVEQNTQFQIVTELFEAPKWYEGFFRLIEGSIRSLPIAKRSKPHIPAILGIRG